MTARQVFFPVKLRSALDASTGGWQPHVHHVAAIMFTALDRPGQVLVGIRRPETNRRHPGVVSIPTIRIPGAMLELFEGAGGHCAQRLDGPNQSFGLDDSTSSVEGAIVELVLAKKILSGGMLNGTVKGLCSARLLMHDLVDDPSGRDGSVENTKMLTIAAECSIGSAHLTGSTASYEDLTWISTDQLLTAASSGDGREIFPDRASAEVCVRGLCIKSAVELVHPSSTTREHGVVAG